MNNRSEIIKNAVLVTVGSLLSMALSFLGYYLIFMLFETMGNQNGSYDFVSPVRVGYGILWMILCPILYRTRLPEWMKACMLAASLTTFIAGIGVQLYETPFIGGMILFLAVATALFLLLKTKKKWFHFYAVALAIVAGILYL